MFHSEAEEKFKVGGRVSKRFLYYTYLIIVMETENIRKMVEEGKKHKFSVEVERLMKILEDLEQQRKSNIMNKIEYWKAE